MIRFFCGLYLSFKLYIYKYIYGEFYLNIINDDFIFGLFFKE